MTIIKEMLMMLLKSTIALTVLMLLFVLAVLALSSSVTHLPVWACFITFPFIGACFVTLLACAMALLDIVP